MKESLPGKRKQVSWIRKRHGILTAIFGPLVGLYARLKYHVKADRFKEQGKRPYLILYNHQTPFDQFFVMMSFRGAVYYVATEDIFSIGFISSIIRWVVAPIPIKKQTSDINAMRTILKVAKEGGTIAIAPEGNRTYSGKTEYMLPTIARLAKKLRLPIALYRIEGGYGVQPRWSDIVRKGQMHAYVAEVIEPEEFEKLSNDELFERIRKGLTVNEANSEGIFRSKRKAEYLERAIYVCPFCGFSKFESLGDEVQCVTCHRKIRYFEDKHMEGEGFDFPFTYVNDWYEYQKAYVNHFDLLSHVREALFTDAADISEVIPYQRKQPMAKEAVITLYGDRMEIRCGEKEPWVIPFDKMTSAAVLGRNKLNIYYEDRIYQFKGDKRFNALKYMNFFYRYKNMMNGDDHGEFLGL